MAIWVVKFQWEGYKIDRFLARKKVLSKIPLLEIRKLLNFLIRNSVELSKIGHHFRK